jgi:predicted GIY-YIG superfamily endonuclease
MGQLLLLPDARPLDERLGRSFFREAPRRPGVYLMKDAAGRVLYVGKAKNLKQRLNNYRVANPDRMPARHLRMVREVSRIEFQFCANETAALEREARLLRALKPKFNRAGVWPGTSRFIQWRSVQQVLEMTVAETPENGWRRFGPLCGGASYLHQSLTRLLWLAANPGRAVTELPAGWARGAGMERTSVECGPDIGEVIGLLDAFFWDSPVRLVEWVTARLAGRISGFERAAVAAEL